MPGIILSVFTCITSFNSDNTMKCKYYCYPHFKINETKEQQGHTRRVIIEPRQPVPRVHAF